MEFSTSDSFPLIVSQMYMLTCQACHRSQVHVRTVYWVHYIYSVDYVIENGLCMQLRCLLDFVGYGSVKGLNIHLIMQHRMSSQRLGPFTLSHYFYAM